MTLDDLRSTSHQISKFDPKMTFDLDPDPQKSLGGQGLYMLPVWSRSGQGLRSYGCDLEMTWDDLGSTSHQILKFDPTMTFDLDPDPFKIFVRSRAIHATSLVEVESRVTEL